MLAPSRVRLTLLVLAVVIALGATAYQLLRPKTIYDVGPLDQPSIPAAPDDGEEVLVAVADIATCDQEEDEAVAQLVAELPGTVAIMGDVVYPRGTEEAYRDCFLPAWGEELDRIRPAPGNHDYVGREAQAYFDLFGEAAGEPGKGWYSYELGSWHVVVLNSVCGLAGGCGPGSEQYEWLQADLADVDPSDCLLAYWHHPRYSSGRHGNNGFVEPIWEAVVDAGVDVTLHGHDHDYERLEFDGVESFIVGTGGRSLYVFERLPHPETVVRDNMSYGALYLVLGEDGFRWEYLSLAESDFTDSGEGDCA